MKHDPARGRELRVLRAELRENRRNLSTGAAARFARDRAPLDLQRASIRIAAQLAAAFDERRVERRRPKQRVTQAALQIPVERLELAEHSSHPKNRVAAISGAAAVSCPPFRLNFDPLES